MTGSRSRRTRQAAAAALLVLLAGPALGACSGLAGTNGQSYISGEGTVTQMEPAERDEPVEFDGTTLDGDEVDIADFRGQVVVINIWGSWCPPCREEMPDLINAHEDLGDDVAFLGINVRETSKANAEAFERSYDVAWPSIDDQGGSTLLALRGVLPPTATPSTLVLDAEGRVAARILGPVPSAITLKDLVEDAAT